MKTVVDFVAIFSLFEPLAVAALPLKYTTTTKSPSGVHHTPLTRPLINKKTMSQFSASDDFFAAFSDNSSGSNRGQATIPQAKGNSNTTANNSGFSDFVSGDSGGGGFSNFGDGFTTTSNTTNSPDVPSSHSRSDFPQQQKFDINGKQRTSSLMLSTSSELGSPSKGRNGKSHFNTKSTDYDVR